MGDTRGPGMRDFWRNQGTRHEGNVEGTRELGMRDFWKDQGTGHEGI